MHVVVVYTLSFLQEALRSRVAGHLLELMEQKASVAGLVRVWGMVSKKRLALTDLHLRTSWDTRSFFGLWEVSGFPFRGERNNGATYKVPRQILVSCLFSFMFRGRSLTFNHIRKHPRLDLNFHWKRPKRMTIRIGQKLNVRPKRLLGNMLKYWWFWIWLNQQLDWAKVFALHACIRLPLKFWKTCKWRNHDFNSFWCALLAFFRANWPATRTIVSCQLQQQQSKPFFLNTCNFNVMDTKHLDKLLGQLDVYGFFVHEHMFQDCFP